MLCITRKQGESLVIGKDVVLTVRAISRGRIKLLIDAPREVHVVRGELKEDLPDDR